MEKRTNLTRALWLKNVCHTLNLKHKESLLGGGIYPQKIAYWLRNWILDQLADGSEVELPGLGVFYTTTSNAKIPTGRVIAGEPLLERERKEMREQTVTVIRFRAFKSAKVLLKRLAGED